MIPTHVRYYDRKPYERGLGNLVNEFDDHCTPDSPVAKALASHGEYHYQFLTTNRMVRTIVTTPQTSEHPSSKRKSMDYSKMNYSKEEELRHALDICEKFILQAVSLPASSLPQTVSAHSQARGEALQAINHALSNNLYELPMDEDELDFLIECTASKIKRIDKQLAKTSKPEQINDLNARRARAEALRERLLRL